jgi:hypothetical protein
MNGQCFIRLDRIIRPQVNTELMLAVHTGVHHE